MNFMNKMQAFLEKYISPIAEKLNSNKAVKSLSGGMMYAMPVTLGVCVISIIFNLPVTALQTFLTNTGLMSIGTEVLNVTINMLGIYMCACISYQYAKNSGVNGLTGMVISLATYLILLPLESVGEGRSAYSVIPVSYMGSKGIFVAIVVGLGVTALLCKLLPKVQIKLPDSVPPMVTDSLKPTFAAMIIFAIALLAKWGLTYTSFGNFFDLVNTLLATPIANVGASPFTLVLVYAFSNLLWFFGVHPSAIMNVYSPIISYCMVGNLEAYMAGTPVSELPNLTFIAIYTAVSIGGSANLMGLTLNMLRAKSEKYKAISKLAIVPSIFNISEPVMFGVPVVMNPMYFIPMVLSTPVAGAVSWLCVKIGLANALNPSVYVAWAMPKFIANFMMGGFKFMLLIFIVTAASYLLYMPFFRADDARALKEEQAQSAE